LKNRRTMINLEFLKENSKGKEVETPTAIEQKGIKIPKIKKEETDSNNPELRENSEKKKEKNQLGR
ncbi:hypothetical protein ACMBCN_02385, partial [Candidatus Liberibacter asiaticus]|nr:hypothetical protein [Candidatus Liberibacter asiaticus]